MAATTATPRARKASKSGKLDLTHAQRVILYVSDWKRALKFYQETLRLPLAYPAEDGWASFQLKGIELSLHSGCEKGKKGSNNSYFGFYVNDFDAAYAELKSRGVKMGKITSPCGGTRFSCFSDPDGNELGIEGE